MSWLCALRDRTIAFTSTFLAPCNRYGSAVTAIATMALAVITFFYLWETRQQRQLAYTQFLLTSSPDIAINSPIPFSFGDPMGTGVTIENNGWQVEEAGIAFIILCCEPIETLARTPHNRQGASMDRTLPSFRTQAATNTHRWH